MTVNSFGLLCGFLDEFTTTNRNLALMSSPTYQTSWNKTSIFQKMWDEAQDPKSDHPYLVKKNISPNGIGQTGDNLIIPIFLGKEITGIQTIAPDGTKKFAAGSKINGGYYEINPKLPKDKIYILEGFAKAVSVCDATGIATFCAFNAGNLPKCAVYLRESYFEAEIVIGADGDTDGIKFAEEAARVVNGFVVYAPDGKDFSDVSILDYEPQKPPVKIEVVREIKDYSSYDETFDKATIEDMLSHISPDISYHEWIEIGMALKAGGASLGVWDGWSKGSTKYKKNDCYTHWQSFKDGAITIGTLVHHARLNGWTRKYEVTKHHKQSDVDINAIIENAANKIKKKAEVVAKKIDQSSFSGVIMDTVNWIVSISPQEQPTLALLNVLSVLGAVFGRRYKTRMDTRTNVYLVGVCRSGAGKEISRTSLQKLCRAAGLGDILGDDEVRSDSGIVKSLVTKSSQVMMVDEFGLFLAAIKDKKAAPHLKSVSKLFLKLYSCSSGSYRHGTYASEKMESMELVSPNLCIYGTTTEKTYIPALTEDSLESGELNRFIVLCGDDKPAVKHADVSRDPPQSLVDKWKGFIAEKTSKDLGTLTNSSTFESDPKEIGWGDQWPLVCELFDKQNSKTESGKYAALWARYRENILKIAMIYCISEGKDNLEEYHLRAGQSIVEASIKYMEDLATRHVYDSPWEQMYLEVLEILRKCGGKMKKSELGKAMRKMKIRDFEELLRSMYEHEIIRTTKIETAGRPVYFVEVI